MKYSFEKENGGVKINFELNTVEWNDAVLQGYNKQKNKFKIPGFRPGKAPKKVIESIYGASIFYDEAFNIAFEKAYDEFLDKEQDVFAVGQPEVSFDGLDDDGIKFSAFTYVKPEVKLGKYKGVKVERGEVDVSSNEVDAEIAKTRDRLARMVEVTDRAAKEGDHTIIDYSGSVDGKKFEGGTAQGQTLVLGSNSFIPGFETQVVGMKIGESKDIKVKFPDEYHSEELKGKDAVFAVKLCELKEKQLPELNDDFAKDVSSFDTFDEYRESVLQSLSEAKQKQVENKLENDIIDAVAATVSLEIPKPMIERQLDYFLQEFSYRLAYQGMKIEDYFKYTGTSEDDYRKEREEDAKKAVKTRLVIEQIIKEEKLEVGDQELEQKLSAAAEQNKKPLDDYKKELTPRQLDYFKNEVLMDKLMEFLKANAQISGAKKPAATKAKTEAAPKTDSSKKAAKPKADKK